jgi:DNA-binding HxlR family transcriptional regulator/predicted transcriptional regulator
MKTENPQTCLKRTMEQESLADTLKQVQEECTNCRPISMLECVTNCNVWKLKNEFRELYNKMQNPAYPMQLLNTLKNKRRLQILEKLSKGKHSAESLQQELKKLEYFHSLGTMIEEYVFPLLETGMASEGQNKYHATLFGSKTSEMMKEHHDTVCLLPAHSEGYEERILGTLLEGSKTFEDLKHSIVSKSAARVLSRLQRSGLIETPAEKDSVFFFKSLRDPNKEKLSPTEKRIHDAITREGIPARKLADKSAISLRRIYKYLRRLKGKKLVFARKKTRRYSLSALGQQTALMLQRMNYLAADAKVAAEYVVRAEHSGEANHEDKREVSLPLPSVQCIVRK